MDESALKVFISHSNKAEDHGLVSREVVPKLERNNITICGQTLQQHPILFSKIFLKKSKNWN